MPCGGAESTSADPDMPDPSGGIIRGVTKISRNLHVRDAPSAATEGLK